MPVRRIGIADRTIVLPEWQKRSDLARYGYWIAGLQLPAILSFFIGGGAMRRVAAAAPIMEGTSWSILRCLAIR